MKRLAVLAAALALGFVSPVLAQLAPGSAGNGGRIGDTMLPGALPPPPGMAAPSSSPSPTTWGSRYPRYRIESQGYRVDNIDRQNNGSWKAETTRDIVDWNKQGVPSKVTIYPDGRIIEQREPSPRP
jgi:hypothetical protein